MMTKALGVAASLAVLAAAPLAQAAQYTVSYNSTSGSLDTALLDIVTSNVLNAYGGYDVLSVGGNIDGAPISLAPVSAGTPPNESSSPDGLYKVDDVLFPSSAAFLSNNGLLLDSSFSEYSFLWSAPNSTAVAPGDSSAPPELLSARGGLYATSSTGVATISAAVPEPATWATMLLGVFGIGAILRRRRHQAALA